MPLARRLDRLEALAGHRSDVTWEQYVAASDRVLKRAHTVLQAATHRRESPPLNAADERRDTDVLWRWGRQQGVSTDTECAGARQWLLGKLRALRRTDSHADAEGNACRRA